MGIFQEIVKTVEDKLLPRRCPLCGVIIGSGERICGSCSDNLVSVEQPICKRCGREMFECVCPDEGFWFDRCIAPFVYTRAARNGVKRLKFKNDTSTADFFGRRMAVAVRQEYRHTAIDLVIEVPTHRIDWEQKGYNHAALIARSTAKALELKFTPGVLKKTRRNEKQHTLNRAERAENVKGVFRVLRPEMVAGKTVLICDDVTTTGSTLNECARVLKAAGARTVLCASATAAQRSSMSSAKQAMLF